MNLIWSILKNTARHPPSLLPSRTPGQRLDLHWSTGRGGGGANHRQAGVAWPGREGLEGGGEEEKRREEKRREERETKLVKKIPQRERVHSENQKMKIKTFCRNSFNCLYLKQTIGIVSSSRQNVNNNDRG